MKGIEKIRSEHQDVGSFARAYADYLGALLGALNPEDIRAVCDALESARTRNATVFVVGNGGSASTSAHIGVDVCGAGFKAGSKRPLRVHPLADHVANMTAFANDFGYDQVFARQLRALWREGDVLLVLSASGNSPNIVEAARWVRERGGDVLGLLGFDGGKVKELCQAAVVVQTPKGDYGPVEDVHHILNHIFTLWLHLPYSKPR